MLFCILVYFFACFLKVKRYILIPIRLCGLVCDKNLSPCRFPETILLFFGLILNKKLVNATKSWWLYHYSFGSYCQKDNSGDNPPGKIELNRKNILTQKPRSGFSIAELTELANQLRCCQLELFMYHVFKSFYEKIMYVPVPQLDFVLKDLIVLIMIHYWLYLIWNTILTLHMTKSLSERLLIFSVAINCRVELIVLSPYIPIWSKQASNLGVSYYRHTNLVSWKKFFKNWIFKK